MRERTHKKEENINQTKTRRWTSDEKEKKKKDWIDGGKKGSLRKHNKSHWTIGAFIEQAGPYILVGCAICLVVIFAPEAMPFLLVGAQANCA